MFLNLGQNERVVEHAHEYLKIALPALFSAILYICLNQWLIQMKYQSVLVPITSATLAIYIYSAYTLGIVYEMGPEGLAWALLIELSCQALFASIYAHCFVPELQPFRLSSEIF